MPESVQRSANELLASGPGLTADQRSWFAIQTRPRYEKKATAELQEKGITTFLPLYSAVHQWSDRRRLVHLPIFPGYVFVRIAPALNTRILVLRTNGVTNFVGVRNVGVPIPDGEIEAVQAILKGGATFRPHSYIRVGQRVCIRGGCMDGLSGILMAVNGDQSLIVSINLIQRSITMRIEGYEVEPV